MNNRFLLCCTLLVLTVSCTPVSFYSDPELQNKSGLKFYTVKPFLLTESEAETGRIVKMSVLYLPDLSSPGYMSIKNAPGASKTDLKLNDGILTSFGMESESLLPESMEAFAALISKTAAAAEDINGLKSYEAIKSADNTVRLYEIVIEQEKTWLREVNSNINTR